MKEFAGWAIYSVDWDVGRAKDARLRLREVDSVVQHILFMYFWGRRLEGRLGHLLHSLGREIGDDPRKLTTRVYSPTSRSGDAKIRSV